MHSLYSASPTWLHPWPAGRKLLLISLGGIALFALQSPALLALAAMACAALWWSLGQATAGARRLLWSVLVGALLVAMFHLWQGRPDVAARAALRWVSAVCLGVALTVSTRPSDLVAAIEWLLTPLARLGVATDRLALQFGLMLRFVDHFLGHWQRLDDAYRLRTGRSGGLRLLSPLLLALLSTSARLADALWLRIGR